MFSIYERPGLEGAGSVPQDVPLAERHQVPTGKRLRLLEGVRILDLTSVVAGPFGSSVLADLGADVLKVESLVGDTARSMPPFYFAGDSTYFLALNRNKRSVAIDLKSAAGQQVLSDLLKGHDVVLMNARNSQRASLGLSDERIRTINPRLVSCSITGFGSSGPYRDRPAYDLVVQALSGIMSLTGPVDGPVDGPSVRAGVPVGDLVAGLYGAIGILAGLQRRSTTGLGTHIEVAMLDGQVSLLSYLAQAFLTDGYVAGHQGRAHMSIPSYDAFPTADGEIVVAAFTDEMFVRLCSVLKRPDIPVDPRFATRQSRLTHRGVLVAELRSEFSLWRTEAVYEALVEAQIPAGPINGIDAALGDAQVVARDMVVGVQHRAGERFRTVGVPLKAPECEGDDFFSPPGLGENGPAVLAQVGYSELEIRALVDDGVIGGGNLGAPAGVGAGD
jgi:CoA:oxalate CoA-transferase